MNEAYSSAQARKKTCTLGSSLHVPEGNAGCNQVIEIKESEKGHQFTLPCMMSWRVPSIWAST